MSAHRFGRLSLLAVLAALQLGAARCARKPTVTSKSKAPVDAQADSADQVMYGVRSVLTHQGATKGIMLADTGYVFEDGTRLELRGVTVTFINAVGIKDAVMTARRGTYRVRNERVEARGPVLVVGAAGRRLETERLTFDLVRNLIVGDSAFVLIDSVPKRRTPGVGFELEPKLTKPPKVVVPKAAPKSAAKAPAKAAAPAR